MLELGPGEGLGLGEGRGKRAGLLIDDRLRLQLRPPLWFQLQRFPLGLLGGQTWDFTGGNCQNKANTFLGIQRLFIVQIKLFWMRRERNLSLQIDRIGLAFALGDTIVEDLHMR